MTSATAQDQFTSYGLGNWESKAAIDDYTPLRPSGGETPFNSIGSASVSLGRDRFARYAAQRLARSSIEHLLRDLTPQAAQHLPHPRTVTVIDALKVVLAVSHPG
jgi:hypothetical protein